MSKVNLKLEGVRKLLTVITTSREGSANQLAKLIEYFGDFNYGTYAGAYVLMFDGVIYFLNSRKIKFFVDDIYFAASEENVDYFIDLLQKREGRPTYWLKGNFVDNYGGADIATYWKMEFYSNNAPVTGRQEIISYEEYEKLEARTFVPFDYKRLLAVLLEFGEEPNDHSLLDALIKEYSPDVDFKNGFAYIDGENIIYDLVSNLAFFFNGKEYEHLNNILYKEGNL